MIHSLLQQTPDKLDQSETWKAVCRVKENSTVFKYWYFNFWPVLSSFKIRDKRGIKTRILIFFISAEVEHHIFPRGFYIVDRPTLAVGLHRIQLCCLSTFRRNKVVQRECMHIIHWGRDYNQGRCHNRRALAAVVERHES